MVGGLGQSTINKQRKTLLRRGTTGDHMVKQQLVKRSLLDDEFLQQQSVEVRVYILTVNGLSAMDSDGLSDPYVKVKLGCQVVDDSQNY